jgi:phage/plasmid-like protein (TIGR03299 family)
MSVQVTSAAQRKAPWINAASWVNTNEDQISAADVLTNANLDWTVQHTPLFANFDGNAIEVPSKSATTRVNADGSASVLGITSPSYSIVQNQDIVQMIDAVTYEAGAIYVSAGELRGGRKIFLASKLPNTLNIGGVDPVDTYLMATNTHDGTDAFKFQLMQLRLICTNGMMGYTTTSSISFRHTSGMNVQIEDVRATLSVTLKATEEFSLRAEELIAQSVTDDKFVEIVNRLLPIDINNMTTRQVNSMQDRRYTLASIWNGPTQENIKGTAWGVVNAFTEYEQWARTTRSLDDFAVGERFMLNQGTTLSDRVLEMVS